MERGRGYGAQEPEKRCPKCGRTSLGGGCFRLPIVAYQGKKWFFDDRLKQVRNIKSPHEWIDLNKETLVLKQLVVH